MGELLHRTMSTETPAAEVYDDSPATIQATLVQTVTGEESEEVLFNRYLTFFHFHYLVFLHP